MHILYVDESYDHQKFVMTALCIEDVAWRQTFDAMKAFRQQLKTDWGIKISSELHAKVFVRDCSDKVSTRKLSQPERRQIFELVMNHIAGLQVVLLNVCLDVPRWGGTARAHAIAVERLSNRVQTMMRATGSHAIVVFDEGKEAEIRKTVRRMNVFNPIPSAYGAWDGGAAYRNIVLDRFIEDVWFKESKSSFFLQLVDFAAWALLKSEVPPTPFIARFGYQTMHALVHPICFRPASRRDPLGIVR